MKTYAHISFLDDGCSTLRTLIINMNPILGLINQVYAMVMQEESHPGIT